MFYRVCSKFKGVIVFCFFVALTMGCVGFASAQDDDSKIIYFQDIDYESDMAVILTNNTDTDDLVTIRTYDEYENLLDVFTMTVNAGETESLELENLSEDIYTLTAEFDGDISGAIENKSGDKRCRSVSKPVINLFYPDHGSRGTEVTIGGRNFGIKTGKLYFYKPPFIESGYNSTVSKTPTSWTDREVKCKVPRNKAGKLNIKLETDDKIRTDDVFFFMMRPVIESVFPSSGIPGAKIIITGNYFGVGSKPSIYFSSKTPTVINITSTDKKFQFNVPSYDYHYADRVGETMPIWLSTPDSDAEANKSNTVNFTFLPENLPNLTSLNIVPVSKKTGTATDDSPLYTTDNLYVDFYILNNGGISISKKFSVILAVDGKGKKKWDYASLSKGGSKKITDFSIGKLTAGVHNILFYLDSGRTIGEGTELDNLFLKTIVINSPSEDYYKIKSEKTGLCLDVTGGSQEYGADVSEYNCNNGDNQLWELIPADNSGYYQIMAKHSGKCIGVENFNQKDGADIFQLQECNEDENMLWKIVPSSFTSYNFIAKHSGKKLCADADGNVKQSADSEKYSGNWKFYLNSSSYSFESYNYSDYYIRHSYSMGKISKIYSDTDKKDATFKLVQGLADSNCISFESVNYPGYYLRHQNSEIKLHKFESSDGFKKDATFWKKDGLAYSGYVSFESYNYPGKFMRHSNYKLRIDTGSSYVFKKDATFKMVNPLWQ